MKWICVLVLGLSCLARAESVSPAEQCVAHYAAVYGVPAELIGALIDVESAWNA